MISAKKTHAIWKERDLREWAPFENGVMNLDSKFFQGDNKMKENEFQAQLIKDLKLIIPDGIVLKNDANYKQGIPDLLILNGDRWAMLECKVDDSSSFRPNQKWYLDKLDKMSFARVINKDNREEVLDELLRSLKT